MSEGTEFSPCPASDALWAGRSREGPHRGSHGGSVPTGTICPDLASL